MADMLGESSMEREHPLKRHPMMKMIHANRKKQRTEENVLIESLEIRKRLREKAVNLRIEETTDRTVRTELLSREEHRKKMMELKFWQQNQALSVQKRRTKTEIKSMINFLS